MKKRGLASGLHAGRSHAALLAGDLVLFPVFSPVVARALTALVLLGICTAPLPISAQTIDIGQKADDYRLQDTAGKTHSLGDYAGNVLVLAFWSFKCPSALAVNDRLAAMQKTYAAQGVVVLAVDSNANESKEEIQRNSANLHISFPILLDSEGEVAQKLGAAVTPSVFLIDRNGILRYKGSLEGRDEKKRQSAADEALERILAGKAVTNAVTQASGCVIKRKSS